VNKNRFWILFLVFELILVLVLQWIKGPAGDVVIHLNTAERMIHGEKLYRDIIAFNLPICFYLRYPVIYLSEWTHISALGLSLVFDNLFSALSFCLCLKILNRLPFMKKSGVLGFLCASLGFLLFLVPAIQGMSGQKEFFFFIFTLPYFLLVALQEEEIGFSGSFRAGVAVLSAVGFAYKPTCVLPLLIVQGYRCLQARSLRPLLKMEFVLIFFLGMLYVESMFLFFEAYFKTIVPFTSYFVFASPYQAALWPFVVRLLLPFAIPAFILWICQLYLKPPLHRFYNVLYLVAVGDVLNGVLQFKPYHHHFYPVYAAVWLIFALACAASWANQYVSSSQVKGLFWNRSLMDVILAVALIGLSGHIYSFTLNKNESTKDDLIPHVIALSKKLGVPKNGELPLVYEMSYAVAPMFPYGIEAGLKWKYHFCELWLINGILHFKEENASHGEEWINQQVAEARDFVQSAVTEDIRRNSPDFLMVDYDWRRKMSLTDFFTPNPDFAALLAQYKYLEFYGGMSIFVKK
jgi:hypothetical protein